MSVQIWYMQKMNFFDELFDHNVSPIVEKSHDTSFQPL